MCSYRWIYLRIEWYPKELSSTRSPQIGFLLSSCISCLLPFDGFLKISCDRQQGALATTAATATRMSKKQWAYWAKQQICTRITLFLYISLPSLHDYDVKMHNFTFNGGRKRATTNFSFSFLNLVWPQEIKLPENSPTFDISSELEQTRKKFEKNANSFLKWRFRCRRRLRC